MLKLKSCGYEMVNGKRSEGKVEGKALAHGSQDSMPCHWLEAAGTISKVV